MVAADGNTDVYSIATNTKTYLGTNQVGVEFDESTGRFFIKAIHCPLFYTPGASDAQPSVALLSTNSAAPNTNRAVWCGSNGGILLTRLEPTSFWSGILKLNETSLVTTFEHTDVKSIGGFNSAFPKCSVQAGVNTTDAYLGLDAAIVKSNQFMITPTPPLYQGQRCHIQPVYELQFHIQAVYGISDILCIWRHIHSIFGAPCSHHSNSDTIFIIIRS